MLSLRRALAPAAAGRQGIRRGLAPDEEPSGRGPGMEDDQASIIPVLPSRAMPRRGLLLLLCASVLLAYAVRHPPETQVLFDARLFGRPDLSKVLALIRSVGCLGLLNAAAWGLAAPLARRLGSTSGGWGLGLAMRLGAGFLILSDLVLALAAVHQLTVAGLTAVLGAGLLACALAARREARDRPWGRPTRGGLLALAGFGVLLANPFGECLVPFHGWDALTYHLALPERYLHANAVVVTPYSFYSAFPLNTEMLYAVGLGIDSETTARLLHFELGVLCLLALYALGRQISPLCAALGPLFLLADPLFSWELTIAYSDLALAFYTLLAVIALQEWVQGAGLPSVVRGGLFAGAALATRYQGAFVPAALCAVILASPFRAPLRDRLKAAAVVAALGLLVASPWLVRNVVFTGDPVAPMFQSLFSAPGHEYFDPIVIDQQRAFARVPGMGRGALALVMLPWNLTMRSVQGRYLDSFGFQVGPLYLLAVLLSLALVRRGNRPARPFLAVALLLTLAWFFTGQEARFLVPVFPLLAFAGAVALAALTPPRGLVRAGFLAVPLLGVLYAQWPLWNRATLRYGYALGRLPKDDLELSDPAAAVGRYLRATLGPGDRLLLVRESRAFYFRGLDYVPYHINEGSPVLMLVHRARDLSDLDCRLAAMGVTHVLLNRNVGIPPMEVAGYGSREFQEDLQRIDAFLRERTRPVVDYRGVYVGRLTHAGTCPAPAAASAAMYEGIMTTRRREGNSWRIASPSS